MPFDPSTAKPVFDPTTAKPVAAAAPAAAPPTGQSPILTSFLNNPAMRLAHDAVIEPAIGLGSAVYKAGQGVTSLGGMAPNAVSDFLGKNASDIEGIERPFSDARDAARNTPGYRKARVEADADAPKSSLGVFDQVTAPLLPGADATVAYARQALRNIGGSLSGKPVTVTAADAANAQADATGRYLADYYKKHPVASTVAALAPVAITLGQASARPLAQLLRSPKGSGQAVDTLAAAGSALKKQATAAYGVVNRSGMRVAPTALNDMLNKIYATNVNGASVIKPSMNPTLYPKAASVLGELRAATQGNAPLSLTELSELRQMASDAAADYSASPADRMRSHIIKNGIDDFVTSLEPKHMHPSGPVDAKAISALATARDLWSRQAHTSEILRIMQKARNDAGVNFTQSGYEHALRRRFKNLANNDSAFAQLSPDLKKAVMKIVEGGPLDNFLRNYIAKLAPHGFLPLAGHAAAIGSAYEAGGLPAAAGATAIPVAGELARNYVTRTTAGRAADAARVALDGRRVVPPPGPAPFAKIPPANLAALGLPATMSPQQQYDGK